MRVFVDEMGRLLVALFGDFDDLAVVHAGDAVGVGEDAVVVGDDDDGAAGGAGDLAEEVEHDLAVLRVERGGGFVADDERRFVDERAGDGDALLLAAGEFVRSFLPSGAEADLVEDFARADLRAFPLETPWMSSGTPTFSAKVRVGMRLNCWKMKPMFFARKRVSAPPDIFSSALPKTLMVPLSTRMVPAMALSRVVFPQPDGPTNIRISPVRAWRLTCLSTWMRSGPSPKLFSTARTSTTIWWDGGDIRHGRPWRVRKD